MKNYKILSTEDVDHLASYVTVALNDGWSLCGGVFVTYNFSEVGIKTEMYNQAIIKDEVTRPEIVEKMTAFKNGRMSDV